MPIPDGTPQGGVPSRRSASALLTLILVAVALAALAATALAAGTVIDTDTTISGRTVWANGTYEVRANVTVAPGGMLVVSNATVAFRTAEEGAAGIFVDKGGALEAEGATFAALDKPYSLVVDGRVTLANSTLSGLMSSPPARFVYFDSVGGLMIDGGTAVLRNVTISGTSSAMVTAFDSTVEAHGLTLAGEGLGMLLIGCTANVTDLRLDGFYLGLGINGSKASIDGAHAVRCNSTMWAMDCDLEVRGLVSLASQDHIGAWNCTLRVEDSTFDGGSTGVLALGGVVDVVGCTFDGTITATELAYNKGSIVRCVATNCTGVAFSLSVLDSGASDPEFTMDHVTVRDGDEAAVAISECGKLWLTNLTIQRCGDGVSVSGSTVHLVDSRITNTKQCNEQGCSTSATGTGIWLETTILWLENTTVTGSDGPGVFAYYSDVHASRSRIVDGNGSGLIIVYGGLGTEGCTISGNRLYGLDVLGYPVPLASQGAVWGNGKADVRLNMTLTAKAVDDKGATLAHANVTATSHGTTVGPMRTGFVGTTASFELTVHEFTYPASSVSFSPWAFTVSYGGFTNTTAVDLDAVTGEVTLVVGVLRPDLVVEGLKAPKTLAQDRRTTLRATVRNAGHYQAEKVVLTFYYRNSAGFTRVIGELNLGTIAAGATKEGSANWTMEAVGDYTVVASADVDMKVEEESEGNNAQEAPVEVTLKDEGGIPDPGALLAVAAIVAVSAVAVLAFRRRGPNRPS